MATAAQFDIMSVIGPRPDPRPDVVPSIATEGVVVPCNEIPLYEEVAAQIGQVWGAGAFSIRTEPLTPFSVEIVKWRAESVQYPPHFLTKVIFGGEQVAHMGSFWRGLEAYRAHCSERSALNQPDYI